MDEGKERQEKTGGLYLCATPIGNLEDITLRVLRTLKEADIIAAEDTRNSIRLLNHYDIHTPMTSYHEYNKYDKGKQLVQKMLAGSRVALISDAGSPGISDPGEELVRMSREAGVEVTVLPGPAACITALTGSGLPTRRFVFEGFLPTDKKEKRRILQELAEETRTIILYEAPHRLVRTLEELQQSLGDRDLVLCRELTKKHETYFSATLSGALAHYQQEAPRGECVLVIRGADPAVQEKERQQEWEQMTLEAHMALYESEGLDRKTAMKRVAADRGLTKRDIYQKLLQ